MAQRQLTTEEFILRSKVIHGDKYDYSLVKYTGARDKIKLICPVHGVFEIRARKHYLDGCGCIKCNRFRHPDKRLTTEEFIKRSIKVHGNKYDYSLVKYQNKWTKVKIICLIHGMFEQVAKHHWLGYGCPLCNESKGENIISKYLINHNVKFKREYIIEGCKDKKHLRFDFGVFKDNELILLIEFDGKQHFESFEYFGGDDNLISIQKRDDIKNNYCQDHNIKLLRIKYNQIKQINKILTENVLL